MSLTAHIHREERGVPVIQERIRGGGVGRRKRRGKWEETETECPGRSIVFGYRTAWQNREEGEERLCREVGALSE